jgi:excisionase family DNA binding protein
MQASPQEREEILSRATCSVTDAAKVLGTGRTQVYKAVNAGTLRSIQLGGKGGRVLIPTVALRDLLAGGTDAPLVLSCSS